MRSTLRAPRAVFAARASTSFLVKKMEIRFFAVSATTSSEKAPASTSKARASGSLRPSCTTAIATSGAG